MDGYRVRFEGLEKLMEAYRRFPEVAGKHLERAMQRSVKTVEGEVKPLIEVGVSGRLRASIGSEVKVSVGSSVVGRVGSSMTEEAYPRVYEAGARPHFPPPENLALWVYRKLRVKNLVEVAGTAIRISIAISRRGIQGRWPFKRGWEASEARVVGFFEEGIRGLADEMNGR